jgi:hypothetical protein
MFYIRTVYIIVSFIIASFELCSEAIVVGPFPFALVERTCYVRMGRREPRLTARTWKQAQLTTPAIRT